MTLKEQIDKFYAQAVELLEHYEQVTREAQESYGEHRTKYAERDGEAAEKFHRYLLDMAASIAALAEFHRRLPALQERLRQLEKKTREEILPRYAGAAETWDAQRAATEKLVQQVARVREAAKPLTTRAYKCPRTLPETIRTSHHPRAANLAEEAKRVVELVSDAVYQSDVTVPVNDLSHAVAIHLSQL